jgi:hypothetical protein
MVVKIGVGSETVQDSEHRIHVFYSGYVVECGSSRRQKRRRDELQGRVLGAGYLDLSLEPGAAFDDKPLHKRSSLKLV